MNKSAIIDFIFSYWKYLMLMKILGNKKNRHQQRLSTALVAFLLLLNVVGYSQKQSIPETDRVQTPI